MTVHIDSMQEKSLHTGLPTIKVVGVGGGGGNVVNRMIDDGISGVEYVVANTDMMVLNSSRAPEKIPLGQKSSKGLGAGMRPDVGRKAAEEDQERIKDVLKGAQMVFISAGMGGGTGTGAAPVVAEIAREMKILTVGVVTTPFKFEGKKRYSLAEEGIAELKKHVDTLMVVPNNKLLEIVSQKTTMNEAFAIADDVLKQAISGITNLINLEGIINLDFADVQTVMSNKGRAIMGTGVASGESRGLEAAKLAIASPLLSDKQISGATGVIINIVADPSFSLLDAEAAAEFIENSADQDADVIFGFVQDESKQDEVTITVIATGFDKTFEEQEPKQSQKLSVADSMKHVGDNVSQVANTAEEEAAEAAAETKKPAVEPEPVDNPEEDALELGEDLLTRVEKELHIPEHLQKTQKTGNDQVDYDVPTFIRKNRNTN